MLIHIFLLSFIHISQIPTDEILTTVWILQNSTKACQHVTELLKTQKHPWLEQKLLVKWKHYTAAYGFHKVTLGNPDLQF